MKFVNKKERKLWIKVVMKRLHHGDKVHEARYNGDQFILLLRERQNKQNDEKGLEREGENRDEKKDSKCSGDSEHD